MYVRWNLNINGTICRRSSFTEKQVAFEARDNFSDEVKRTHRRIIVYIVLYECVLESFSYNITTHVLFIFFLYIYIYLCVYYIRKIGNLWFSQLRYNIFRGKKGEFA